MQALHLICRPDASGNLKGVSHDETTKLSRSGSWDLSPADAQSLIGGWIYLHKTKAGASVFGGVVKGFEPVMVPDVARSERVVFLIEKRASGTGQKWRGQNHMMAYSGRFVPADLPHERAA